MSLLPQIPVLTEYLQVKDELTARINKLNAIQILDDNNKKEVKSAIAEINKVKDRIARYRIDNTNEFLKYIEPYTAQCKELEKLCVEGVATINARVKELEEHERALKAGTLEKLFDFHNEMSGQYKSLLKFDMFFEKSMANKTSSINVVEKQMLDWFDKKREDLIFIEHNTDEPDVIMSIYLKNGLNLTSAITEYQDRFKSESEIKAMIAADTPTSNVEKKLDLRITIKQLPKTKAMALQSFLDNLGVEVEVEVL